MIDRTLSVFGLGKLGSAMLASFAHKGWDVIGVDVNSANVDTINAWNSPVYEPQVDHLIKSNKERIRATTNGIGAVMDSCASFIIVPTPSTENGTFSTRYVEDVIIKIGTALKSKETWHLVIITSTVLPGDSERMKEQLEFISGKKCGEHFGLCYNPDFIAIGRIVRDFLNPDMILIGQTDERSGETLESIHRSIVDSNPSYHRMTLHNAELAKISLNAYCTLKITFANIIGEICENLPRGDAKAVLKAIGSDSRVGLKYFNAGLGYCGPCFPRDNRALSTVFTRYGVNKNYCKLTDEINNYQKERIVHKLSNLMGTLTNKVVSILGLGYKEDVAIVDESVPVEIIKHLVSNGAKIQAYDPAATKAAMAELVSYDNITYASSVSDALSGSDICFIATPWQQFKTLTEDDFLVNMTTPIVLDAWGILNPKSEWSSVKIYRIGINYYGQC